MAKIDAAISLCTVCGADVYDNRADKASGEKSPKWPDFKCKDKENCGESYWLKTPAKRAGAGAPPPRKPKWTWAKLNELAKTSLAVGKDRANQTFGHNTTNEDIRTIAAWLFIAVTRDGVEDPVRRLDEKPKAVEEAEEEPSDLPF